MEIEIKHKISETHLHIYTFELHEDGELEYTGITNSRRNDKNDVWGHEWTKHYAKILEAEVKAQMKEAYYDDYGDLYCDPEVERIKRKYNPCCQKTKEGKSYYSGTFFGCEVTEKPLLSKKELKEAIKKEMEKMVGKMKFTNL